MSFRSDNFMSYIILAVQIFIGLIFLRFVFFWLGYNGHVPILDDIYGFLIEALQWAATGGVDFLLPRSF